MSVNVVPYPMNATSFQMRDMVPKYLNGPCYTHFTISSSLSIIKNVYTKGIDTLDRVTSIILRTTIEVLSGTTQLKREGGLIYLVKEKKCKRDVTRTQRKRAHFLRDMTLYPWFFFLLFEAMYSSDSLYHSQVLDRTWFEYNCEKNSLFLLNSMHSMSRTILEDFFRTTMFMILTLSRRERKQTKIDKQTNKQRRKGKLSFFLHLFSSI